jgi:putative solute:sodium symporter small subunit
VSADTDQPETGVDYPLSNHHEQIYLRRLRNRQLTLSLLALCVCTGAVMIVPLLMLLIPAIYRVEVLGIPLSFLLLVLPAFPLYVAVAHLYERRSNALDGALAEIVNEEQI